MSEAPVLSACAGVKRTYVDGKSGELPVLKGVDLDVSCPARLVGLIGPSGSGKSSLLHAAGLLEHPDQRHGLGHRRRTGLHEAGRAGSARKPAPDHGSASSTSSTTCCRSSTAAGERGHADAMIAGRGRGLCAGAGRGHPARRLGPGRTRLDAPAGPAVGRRAAARRHRPRPDQRVRACCWPTSRPATWTRPPASLCSNPCATWPRPRASPP